MAGKQKPESDQDAGALAFEESFRRLGEMAESLETGGLTLAEATDRYEQGMTLVRRCNQLLDETELRITNLKDAYETPTAGREWDQDEDQDEDAEN
ncbi:MAG: exodeoxyribonuclease VII small subunit [Dehalococcoidia bacterium]|jgi:exodeoxyribonuclease VII small subunit|nr:exodeoxyribonuclease VII small subunit [Dehalococcoidia bacterium]